MASERERALVGPTAVVSVSDSLDKLVDDLETLLSAALDKRAERRGRERRRGQRVRMSEEAERAAQRLRDRPAAETPMPKRRSPPMPAGVPRFTGMGMPAIAPDRPESGERKATAATPPPAKRPAKPRHAGPRHTGAAAETQPTAGPPAASPSAEARPVGVTPGKDRPAVGQRNRRDEDEDLLTSAGATQPPIARSQSGTLIGVQAPDFEDK